MITVAGRVANRSVDFDADIAENDLRATETFLNGACEGKVADELRTLGLTKRPVAAAVLAEVLDCLAEADEEQVYRGGTAMLLDQPEFADSRVVRPLLALLEDGFGMLRILDDALSRRTWSSASGTRTRRPG